MTEPTDFIVTIHALERMAQRFGILVSGMNDREQGEFIHREVMDALAAGRQSKLPPIELAHNTRERWTAVRKDGYVVWTEDKKRGYVMQETDEGLLVLTVLAGGEREEKKRRLLKGRR